MADAPYGRVKVARPDWLAEALPSTIYQLQLIQSGRVPECLVGSFVRTIARRLLRCVHGSIAASAEALTRSAERQAASDKFWETVRNCPECKPLIEKWLGSEDAILPEFCQSHKQEQPDGEVCS